MYLQCTQKEFILLSISYSYGNILPCLKLSLIAKLNLKLANLEEMRVDKIDKMAFGINCRMKFIYKVHVVSYAFKLETVGIARAFWHNGKSRSTA